MKRILSLAAALVLVIVVIAFALQPANHFVLDWAKKASPGKPRVSIVLEFGAKDVVGRDWSGSASVTGATVANREGYRFRNSDKLVGKDGWEVTSRPPIRAPKGKPAVTKLEPISSTGVVMHLEDVKPDAKIAVKIKDGEEATIAVADLLAGKTHALWKDTASVRLLTSANPVAATNKEEDHPAACYGPDGTLWVAYIAYTHRDPSRRIETVAMKQQPKDFGNFYQPNFAEQLFVKSFKDGKWSEPIAITDAKQDFARCAIAATPNGDVFVVYSANRDGYFELYGVKIDGQRKLAPEVRLTKTQGRNLSPAMLSDAQGNLWVACQRWDNQGQAGIDVYTFGPDLKIRASEHIFGVNGNCWHPAISISPRGDVAVAYDRYRSGNYDIEAMIISPGAKRNVEKIIASSPKFEARPSIQYDAVGWLWIAYEEGPEKWGKDYGALAPGKGKPLYNERSVRVVCLDTDLNLKKPSAELPTSQYDPPVLPFEAIKTSKYEKATKYAYPRVGIDGNGKVWLAYRQNFGNRYSSHAGAYWLTFVRRLDGQTWSEPIEVHHSDGLLDHRPVLLPDPSGGLLVVHNTDGRYTTPEVIDNQIYASVVNLPAPSSRLSLVNHQPGNNPITQAVVDEGDAVKRMRDHRVKVGTKPLQYLRGEYHRHTEISWDGSPDGSLEDMFRYAIDAAQMDWIGNGDHDNGAGREYSWYHTQKFSDAYHTRAFTTMYTYERSVPYPHGHRNVMFAKRGILTLPRLAPPPDVKKAEGGVHADDAKMLYRYLHEHDGICASHTSATSMGTDWRDNDPVVEPIVEIYQGDRMSYEMEEAPRAGFDPQIGKEPANVAGWYPKGYVNLALKKGIKFGFQSSSDHWSTHISYFIILSEGRDRDSLLKAVKARHCYAATDNILVDFRSGDKIMGDEVISDQPPRFQVHVVGTGNIAKIDVLRDSEVIDTLKPGGSVYKGEWTDAKAGNQSHYYYIRVLQADGEIAWGSPIWVTRK